MTSLALFSNSFGATLALDFRILLFVLSIGITILFFVYGFNIYYMLKLSRKYKSAAFVPLTNKPTIAIHLPIYNEKYVIHRLLASCAATAEVYGKQLVKISVLDDSDDETLLEAREEVARYAEQGFNVQVIHRNNRSGFKAGALSLALEETEQEFLVVFDSDFLPKPDFLDRAASYITADRSLGVVQFRWSYTNRTYNWITKSVSIGMDSHFLIEQPARSSNDLFLNFNGSAGIIRVSALRDSNGWEPDTLAEDLDASYRMQMNHYRIKFVQDDVPCEITPTVSSFKLQQGRWARGSLQVAKKSLGRLLLAKEIKLRQKLAGSIHLTYYLVHPLMYFSFILAAIAAIFNINTISLPSVKQLGNVLSTFGSNGAAIFAHTPFTISVWVFFAASIALCTAAAWVYYVAAMRRQKMKLLENAPSLVLLAFLGYGISISNTVEAFKAFFSKSSGTFKRTPKYAITRERDTWRDKKYQVPLNMVSIIEAISIGLAAFAIGRAIYFTNYGLGVIVGVYFIAFSFVFLTSIFQSGRNKSAVSKQDYELAERISPQIIVRNISAEIGVSPVSEATKLEKAKLVIS